MYLAISLTAIAIRSIMALTAKWNRCVLIIHV
jgi:hypothetical protein